MDPYSPSPRIPWIAMLIVGVVLAVLLIILTFNSDHGGPRGPVATTTIGIVALGSLPCESSDGPQFRCYLMSTTTP